MCIYPFFYWWIMRWLKQFLFGSLLAFWLSVFIWFSSVFAAQLTENRGWWNFNGWGGTSDSLGYMFFAQEDLIVDSVTTHTSSTATRCRVFSSGWNVLDSVAVSSNVATFTSNPTVPRSNIFFVECDNSGAWYNWYGNTAPAFPNVHQNVVFMYGSNTRAPSNNAFNITSITTTTTPSSGSWGGMTGITLNFLSGSTWFFTGDMLNIADWIDFDFLTDFLAPTPTTGYTPLITDLTPVQYSGYFSSDGRLFKTFEQFWLNFTLFWLNTFNSRLFVLFAIVIIMRVIRAFIFSPKR